MVTGGYTVLALGILGYLFVQNPVELFIIQIVIGIASGVLEPSWDGLFSAHLNETEASSHWASWSGGKDIITGVATLGGAIVVSVFSFQALYAIMSMLSLVAAFLSFRILER